MKYNIDLTHYLIGNYVSFGVNTVKIKSIHTKNLINNKEQQHCYVGPVGNMEHYPLNEYDIEPIKLTEKWLIDVFGFEKYENEGYEDYIYLKNNIYIFEEKHEPGNFTFPLLMRYGMPNEFKSGIPVMYVHEIQNLNLLINKEKI